VVAEAGAVQLSCRFIAVATEPLLSFFDLCI
jgi:hypothetical protein